MAPLEAGNRVRRRGGGERHGGGVMSGLFSLRPAL